MDSNRFLKAGVGLIVLFLVGVFLKMARPILVPFFMALLLSFALTPLLDWMIARKIPKSVALASLLLLSFVVFYLMGVMFYSSGKSLVAELPSYNEMAKSFLESVDRTFHNENLKLDIAHWITGVNLEKLGPIVLSALGPFLSFMSELLLVFVFMIFLLSGRGRMERKIAYAFSPERAVSVRETVRRIDREIQRYLGVRTLIGLIIGVLVTAVLSLFRLPFAVVFGVLAFLLNYVPTLGAIAATLLPAILAGFFFGTFGPAAAILVLLAAVHIVLRDVVERRLMGKCLVISPLLVLFSLFFGAWLWGIAGMILAVPVLAVVKIVFAHVPSLDFLETMMDK